MARPIIRQCSSDQSGTPYSTDDVSATKIVLDLDYPAALEGQVYVVPPKFVSVLVGSSWYSEREGIMRCGEGWIEMIQGETRLFTKTLAEPNAEAISGPFASVDWDEGFVGTPDGFTTALQRAEVILSKGKPEDKIISLAVDKGTLRVQAAGAIGQSRDALPAKGHEDVEVQCSPTLVRRILPHVSFFKVEQSHIALLADGLYHMVAVVGGGGGDT